MDAVAFCLLSINETFETKNMFYILLATNQDPSVSKSKTWLLSGSHKKYNDFTRSIGI